MATTTKKVKVIGQEQYINATTGLVETFTVTSIEERDFNFTKVWMRNFIATLDIVGNRKTKLCMWIIDNIDKNNMLVGTLRDIADRAGVSLETARVTIDILLDADFLRRKSQGLYILNPDIVFKGTKGQRMNILNQYQETERTPMTPEEKLQHIEESIQHLSEQAAKLKRIIDQQNRDSA